MKCKKLLKDTSGETLVEVLVSIFLFLLMMGIMQGAVSYSRGALEENKKIRAENAQIIENLQTASKDPSKYSITEKNLSFSAVTADFSKKGNTVFTVPIQLKTVNVPYTDKDGKQQTTQICIYQKKDISGGAGGGGN